MPLPAADLEVTPVLLLYNNAFLEVDSSLARRRGGLRTLAREAEMTWDLEQGSYDLLFGSDKMASALDLQRALEATESGVCKLQVVERPEGKMMRKMRAEMKLLEHRLTKKMEDSLVDVHRTVAQHESKLDGVIAPMIQSIALEHIDLHRTVALHESKLDGTIAPMVQSIAVEHIDLRNKLEQLSGEVAKACAEVEERHMSTIASKVNGNDDCNTLKKLEQLEIELQKECAARAEHELRLHQEAYNEKELQKEVYCLEDIRPSFLQPALGMGRLGEMKRTSSKPDEWQQWQAQPLASIPYSYKSKALPASNWQDGRGWQQKSHGGDFASFAQYKTLHTCSTKQVLGFRSCPLLPPLQ
jgi:hypothetical protein